MRICIGVHVHAEPERFLATLASLRADTGPDFDLLVLADGPDSRTRAALAARSDLEQFGTVEPLGVPACFNRLTRAVDAQVYVLLESGAQVGPGWLERLLAALDAHPANGLAGPSTNSAWNEQCAFPGRGGSPAEVAAAAREAASRFGPAVRTLEPLHSLADFCYVVHRRVVDAIGAADEGYGLGPCWELDYNVRAVRAGFRGVWACGAYVHRAPFTARRRREEARRFAANRRRYQDKFCALRLLGRRADYEPHCRGDGCEQFAPTELIQIRLPAPAPDRPPGRPAVSHVSPSSPPAPLQPPAPTRPTHPATRTASTLVSCVMPTRGRPAFVLQAIRYFERQDYPNRELIVVDDGPGDLAGILPDDPRIRHVLPTHPMSIGGKRNLGSQEARGEILAHWDDDDWYAQDRLSVQVAPLVDGGHDVTALRCELFLDLERWAFWTCSSKLHRRLFVKDVHGGTLVFRRHVWERLARYPDRSLAEDALFLRNAIGRGARLARLENNGLFIYVRHGGNSWPFRCGQYLDPGGWHRVAEPPLPTEDRTFYASLSAGMVDEHLDVRS